MTINLDEIALASLEARLEGVEETQVNRLIELLESSKSIDLVKVFIARQVGRRQWSRYATSSSAARLYEILSKCTSIDEARKALGYFKWFYEAGRDIRALRSLQSSLRGIIFTPSKHAPSGFADTYLRTTLGLH